jgi:hypothetical protein
MVRQFAAAIRLYRPAVVVVGSDTDDATGAAVEAHLVSRLAQRAADVAASQESPRGFAAVRLPPWKAKRVFVGAWANEEYAAPWEKRGAPVPEGMTTLIDQSLFPSEEPFSIELISQRAAWQLPWIATSDRLQRYTGYSCKDQQGQKGQKGRWPLFTTGLTSSRFVAGRISPEAAELANGVALRMATVKGPLEAVLPTLLERASSADPAAAALAADRLAMVWWRLVEEGKLVQARQAMDAYLQVGQNHPLFPQMSAWALAAAESSEWNAQASLLGPQPPLKPSDVKAQVQKLAGQAAWGAAASGRMLLAHALAAGGYQADAQEVLRRLAASACDPAWQRAAFLELSLLDPMQTPREDRLPVPAPAVSEPGKIDGVLDEPCWAKGKWVSLQGASKRAPAFQAIRTARQFILAVRLPAGEQAGEKETWDVDVAVDADRDGWTQLLLHFDSSGGKKLLLALRDGPTAELDARLLLVQGRKRPAAGTAPAEYTFEATLPVEGFGSGAGGLWAFQIRAVRRGAPPQEFYFQPQDDARMLPERYGLLQVAPPPGR